MIKNGYLYIDIGAKNKKQVEKLITIGDPIIFRRNYYTIQNDRIVSTAIDNHAGVFILSQILKFELIEILWFGRFLQF